MQTYELIIRKAFTRLDEDGDIIIWVKTKHKILIPEDSEFDGVKQIDISNFDTGIDIEIK